MQSIKKDSVKHAYKNCITQKVHNKLRKIKSSAIKRANKRPRRRRILAMRDRRKKHARDILIKAYAKCTCPIENTVLYLENLLMAYASTSLRLALRHKVRSLWNLVPHAFHTYNPKQADATSRLSAVQNNIAVPVPSPG